MLAFTYVLVLSGLLFVILGDPKWPSVKLIPAFVAGGSSSSRFLVHQAGLGQGSYTAQVRATVTDPAHVVVNNAKDTVTNESTSIATIATTNASGEYGVNGLRPANYIIKVEAPGFRNVVRTRLVAGGELTGHGRFRAEPAHLN
jgi:hypothetical protein